MISIVTPWLNASELMPTYEKSVNGAEVIIVDNGSAPDHAERLTQAVERHQPKFQPAWEYLPRFPNWTLIRNETNLGFSTANNQGLAVATGDIVVFMNNDVKCQPSFLDQVTKDVSHGALYGPSLLVKHDLDYIEGWLIAATHRTWDALGGWDDQYYEGLYWEDNDLCFRAKLLGIRLIKTDWAVWHYGNYTTKHTPGAFEHSNANQRKFLARVAGYAALAAKVNHESG